MLHVSAQLSPRAANPVEARVQLSFGEHLLIQATPLTYTRAADGSIARVTTYLLEFACGKRADLHMTGRHTAVYRGSRRARHSSILMTGPHMSVDECLFRLANMNLGGKL